MKRGIAPAIAIGLAIAVLAAPISKLSKQDELLRQQTLANAKQYVAAIGFYCSDNDDCAPYTSDPDMAKQIILPYVKNRSVMETKNPRGGVFHLNPCTASVLVSSIPDPSATPMIYETYGWKDGKRVVGFWNAVIRPVDETEWKKLKKNLNLRLKKG